MRQNQKKKYVDCGNSRRKKEKGTESIFKPIMTETYQTWGQK